MTDGRSKGGRPSLADAERIGDQILDTATALFLAHGYGATSIESIARLMTISKRTFYHRYPDKKALFADVLHRLVLRMRPSGGMPTLIEGDVKQTLTALGKLILDAALQPEPLALHRLLVAESGRFPELAHILTAEGARSHAVSLIQSYFDRACVQGALHVPDTHFAAAQFLDMVVAHPQRAALGIAPPLTQAERDDWVDRCAAFYVTAFTPSPARA